MSDQEIKLQGPPDSLAAESSTIDFDPEDLIGQTLAGRYIIEQRIGKGGMGVVYLASQSALNRKVVVKVLAKAVSDDEEAITRFEREALGLSQLQHPNIVTIYDFGRDKDLAYIVMEYVDGNTLSQLIRRATALSFDDFAHIATQILDALAEAHARGIIHRDIKPSNIMLCERRGHDNVVKVLDFGLAKLVHDSVEVTKKTNLVGSVAFLAPEQILGLEFDQRVDVYALGVLFYYILSGQKPFRGEDDLSVLYQHIHKNPTPLQDLLPQGHNVPVEVISIIHQCLAKDPRDRPENARELLTMFQVDMSRSVFKMPWSTGEWATPTGLSGIHALPGTSSPRVAAPIQAPDTNPSGVHHGVVTPHTDHSGQYSQMSMASGVYPYPPQKSNKGIIIGGIFLLAAVVIGAAVVVSQNKADQPAVVQPSAAQLGTSLDEVEKLIKTDKWGQAETLLKGVQPKLAIHPELLKRGASYGDQITTGKLLLSAQAAENAKDFATARQEYAKVLQRDPEHKLAAERLAALPKPTKTATKPPVDAKLPQLKVDSRVKAKVYLGDTFVGYTPAETQPKPGKYTVVVKARGYYDWSKSIELAGAQAVVLDADLIPMGRRRPKRTTKTTKTTPKTEPKTQPKTTPKTTPKKTTGDGLLFQPGKKKNNGGLLNVNN